MVYYRTKRRYRKPSRRGYRKRFKFSRYNTFRNRSSKAQANQIYSLNKKINTIEKRTKPEIKIFQNTYNFTMSDFCGEIFGGFTTGIHNSIKGRIARIQDISGWFNVWRTPNPDRVNPDDNFQATIRVVVYQIKQSMSGTDLPIHARDLMNITAAEEEATDTITRRRAYMRAVFGPLRYGISSKVKILRDFRISLIPDRERTTKRMKIKKAITLAKSQQTDQPYPQNGVFFVALYVVNKANMAQDEVQVQQLVKVAYIDED